MPESLEITPSSTSPRNRILASLSFHEPDLCPYFIQIDEEVKAPLAKKYGVRELEGTVFCDHLVRFFVVPRTRQISQSVYEDEFGTTWRAGGTPHVIRPALINPSLQGYRFPDIPIAKHFEGLDGLLSANEEKFKIVHLVSLLFENTWGMRGMDNIMMDLHLNPKFVDQLLDGLEEICIRAIDHLIANYADRIDALGIADDYGAQHNMLISPNTWRRFFKPRLNRIFKRIHSAGKFIFFHSCGNIEPIIQDLIEMGVAILHPAQPEAMNVFQLKREYGKDVTFAGGIGTQQLLPFGSPAGIRAEVAKHIRVLCKSGGWIISPSKPIMPDVPLENAIAVIDAIVNQ